MVPDELLPPWRDLATLGWLATRRLGSPVVAVPVLGPVACAATWPVTMTMLIGHRADRTLAAHQRAALVAVRTCDRARVPWRRLGASAAAAWIAVVALCGPPLAAFAAAVVAEAAEWHLLAGALWGTGFVIGAAEAVLIMIGAAPAVRSIAPSQRSAARALARSRGMPLIEAHSLAADDRNSQAATILVRRLLRRVDVLHTAVIAVPRNAAIAVMYRRLGFEPVGPGQDRLLVRWGRL